MLFPRHIGNSLNVYLFLELDPQLGKSEEFSNQVMKKKQSIYNSFYYQNKQKKKQSGFAWNFLETSMQSAQRCCNPLFQCIHFLMFSLFQKYFNSQVRTSIVYYPCSSRLVSKIHPFIFHINSLGLYLSPEWLLIFCSLYILPCMEKILNLWCSHSQKMH